MADIITRETYMQDSEKLHDEYYEQFVNSSTIRQVQMRFGDRIIKSKDEHFNDIPLNQWDALIGWPFGDRGTYLSHNKDRLEEANGSRAYACSDMICIAKAAARMIKRESLKEGLSPC